MNEVWSAAGSLGYGFGSAFVPVLNAEAYVGVYAVAAPLLAALVVVAVSVGQTLGKMVMFEGARRGREALRTRRQGREAREPPPGGIRTRLRHWNARMMQLLEHRHGGAATVLVSASVGLPPLAVVSVVAGTSKLRRMTFAVCCLIGRVVRFAVVALPLAYASA